MCSILSQNLADGIQPTSALVKHTSYLGSSLAMQEMLPESLLLPASPHSVSEHVRNTRRPAVSGHDPGNGNLSTPDPVPRNQVRSQSPPKQSAASAALQMSSRQHAKEQNAINQLPEGVSLQALTSPTCPSERPKSTIMTPGRGSSNCWNAQSPDTIQRVHKKQCPPLSTELLNIPSPLPILREIADCSYEFSLDFFWLFTIIQLRALFSCRIQLLTSECTHP